MRVRLVVNPVASSMTARRRETIEAQLRACHEVETVLTVARDHARDIAATAAHEGVDVVVVAGGDGTLNEAADALVGTSTALAPLPAGSTNVFSRAIGFGKRLDRATDQLLRALAAGSIRRVGVGAANGRHFLFHLGAGFDAAVVERIERRPSVKRYAAHPAFAVQTVRLLASGFDRRDPAIHVQSDAGPNHNSFMTVVSNVTPYTYVGPRRMCLTPNASLDRALAVTSLTSFALRNVLAAAASAVGTAAHLQRSSEVVQLTDVDALRLTAVRADRPFPWQVDGDYLGVIDTLDVRYEPDSLSLVLPH